MSNETPVVETPVVATAPVEPAPVTTNPEPAVKEEPKLETPPVATEPVVEEKISAKLAKQREREARIAEKEKEIAERESKIVERESFIQNLKKKPLQTLKESGLSLQELAELIVKDGGDGIPEDPIQKVTETVEELKNRLAEKEKKEEEARLAAENARIDGVINHYKKIVTDHVVSNKEKYELTNSLGEVDAVFALIEETHQRFNKVLQPEEAAQMVEEYLERRTEALLQTSKIKTKLASAQNVQTEQKPNTLTNGMSSYAAPTQSIPAHLSRDERIAAASKLLRFRE